MATDHETCDRIRAVKIEQKGSMDEKCFLKSYITWTSIQCALGRYLCYRSAQDGVTEAAKIC